MPEIPATTQDPETQALEDAVDAPGDAPRVGIIVGAKDDLPAMEQAGEVLERHRVAYETRVMSPHRDPALVADYCRNARLRGLRVIIAGAGLSAALPGIAASHTDLPVIGVPLSGRGSVAGGLDAILSIVQMPAGAPVAAVGLDNPRSAAHLAIRILNRGDGGAAVPA